MRDRTLKMVVPAVEPPYVNYVNFSDAAVSEKGYGPGVVIEILKEIGKRLNLTYEEVDLLAGGAIMEYDRSVVSDLTYPFQFEPTGILIRSPEKYEDDTLLIVTEPFSWEVWVITAAVILISGVIFLGMTKILKKVHQEMSVTPFESVWVFFSIFVQQGLPEQPRSWSCRVLVALWWLASITLSATFTGSLVALFAVDKTSLPFQNIEQLVKLIKQGKFEIVMDENSFTRTEMIARSKLPVYKDLWHEMNANHKVKYVNGIARGVAFVRANPGYALLGPMSTLDFYAFSDCKVILINDGILPVYLSIPLIKHSIYSPYFSTKIREMAERGFTQKWITDYRSYVAMQKFSECNSTITGPKSLFIVFSIDLRHKNAIQTSKLGRSQGAFWVFFAGVVLGLILFCGEFIFLFIRKKMRKNAPAVQPFEEISTVSPHSIHSISVPKIEIVDTGENDNQKNLRQRNILNLSLDLSGIHH
uniref:PBPe domain-containing protein n=1 Tax=Caenorhabditis japonica TaxID=281687 RepID=A0A8R1DVB3_CAEJA